MTKQSLENITIRINNKEFLINVDNPTFKNIISFVVENREKEFVVEVPHQGEEFDNDELKTIIENSINGFKGKILIEKEKYESLNNEIDTIKKQLKEKIEEDNTII